METKIGILRRRIAGKTDAIPFKVKSHPQIGRWEEYYLFVEQPPEIKEAGLTHFFSKTFIDNPLRPYKNAEDEERVIKWFLQHPLRVKVDFRAKSPFYVDLDRNYWKTVSFSGQRNHNNTKYLNIITLKDLDTARSEKIAYDNLLSVVGDGDLTSGDKRIIRSIARSRFYSLLNYCCANESSATHNTLPTRLHLDEPALRRVSEHGFSINGPGRSAKLVDIQL